MPLADKKLTFSGEVLIAPSKTYPFSTSNEKKLNYAYSENPGWSRGLVKPRHKMRYN